MWRTIRFVQPQDPSSSRTKPKHKSPELRRQGFFEYELTSGDRVYEFEFNLDDFRSRLRFPEADSNGHNNFDEFESNDIMFATLISLGYEVSIVGSPKPIRSPPPKTCSLRSSSSPKTPSPQHSSTSSSSPSIPKSPQMPIHQSSPLPEFNSPIPPTMEPSQSQTIISQIPSSSSLPLSPTPTYFQNRRKSIPVNIQKNLKRSRIEDAHDLNETDSDDETENKFADDVMDILEGQRGNEGGVENTREVERSGLGERQKENVGLRLVENIYKRRIRPRLEDESSQLLQSQTSARHSEVSQQTDVSSLHELNPRNPETVMMSSGHSVDSLEATEVSESVLPLPVDAQRLISQFVEGIEEGQTSELLVARNVITGKLPATESRPLLRLRTGGALVIRTPVASTFPSSTTTTPIIPSIPPTTTSTPTQSFPDPSSPHHSSSSSSSSESFASTEYLSDCSPNRLTTSGLPTDTLIVSLLNRLRSEEPNLSNHKRTIFHSLQAYLSHQETERTRQAKVEALQKRVRELDQQCRLADISRSRDDQDPDDQPEGRILEISERVMQVKNKMFKM
uniref:AP-1-like transcription factor yap1 n=1 Tax=Erigeron canadensis TaxID=72917 RepID=UPI001CB99037|nr:AP-1-like transcription factor yap1 [Erigeron canadensis]